MGTFGFFSLSCQMFSPSSSCPAFPLQPHFPILAFPMFLEGSTTAPQVRNFHDTLLSQKFPVPCKAICTTLKLYTLAMTPLQNLAIDVHVCIAHLSCSYITNTYHTPCCIKLLFSRLFFFFSRISSVYLKVQSGPQEFCDNESLISDWEVFSLYISKFSPCKLIDYPALNAWLLLFCNSRDYLAGVWQWPFMHEVLSQKTRNSY